MGLVLALFFQGNASATPVTKNVSIVDNAFSPTSIKIKIGDSILWTNTGDNTHSATSNNNTGLSLFDSGFLSHNQTFTFLFPYSGKFTYFCQVHTFMTASVSVAPKAGPTSGPAGTLFRITFSTVSITGSDFTAIIQMAPAGGSFQPFATATTGTLVKWDSTGAALGDYLFRVQLHRISTNNSSSFSPSKTVTITA